METSRLYKQEQPNKIKEFFAQFDPRWLAIKYLLSNIRKNRKATMVALMLMVPAGAALAQSQAESTVKTAINEKQALLDSLGSKFKTLNPGEYRIMIATDPSRTFLNVAGKPEYLQTTEVNVQVQREVNGSDTITRALTEAHVVNLQGIRMNSYTTEGLTYDELDQVQGKIRAKTYIYSPLEGTKKNPVLTTKIPYIEPPESLELAEKSKFILLQIISDCQLSIGDNNFISVSKDANGNTKYYYNENVIDLDSLKKLTPRQLGLLIKSGTEAAQNQFKPLENITAKTSPNVSETDSMIIKIQWISDAINTLKPGIHLYELGPKIDVNGKIQFVQVDVDSNLTRKTNAYGIGHTPIELKNATKKELDQLWKLLNEVKEIKIPTKKEERNLDKSRWRRGQVSY